MDEKIIFLDRNNRKKIGKDVLYYGGDREIWASPFYSNQDEKIILWQGRTKDELKILRKMVIVPIKNKKWN
jgi:hypothetical protein